jgi:creatinine amidohydrolase/Fe(II)-dependent formamide hydrolase-like protein
MPNVQMSARACEGETSNGALGDATLASVELGSEIIGMALNKAVEFLVDFMDKNAKS